jgi:uncharacterized protein YndB with AHSA1/START domain
MTEQTLSSGTDGNSLRKAVRVQAPPAAAWRVFTEKMGTWWPLATCKISKANAVDAVIEPRVGRRWYERGDNGTCDWGNILSWQPHSCLVLSWDITADWQYDPTLKTEVEGGFHRGRRDEMRTIFDSTGDWGRLLESFARAAAA